ncbi:MAG: hypothetical protein MI824_06980, partial [Hyphomicrobiales bacterium]|nr:hypothetical protein [Hyphomicrobiales bacterium]
MTLYREMKLKSLVAASAVALALGIVGATGASAQTADGDAAAKTRQIAVEQAEKVAKVDEKAEVAFEDAKAETVKTEVAQQSDDAGKPVPEVEAEVDEKTDEKVVVEETPEIEE